MSQKTGMMISRFVLCFAILIVSSSALSAQTQSGPTAADVQKIKYKVGLALSFAENSWAQVFRNNNVRFQVPGVYYGGDSAFYDPKEHKIFLKLGFLWENVHRAAAMTRFQDDGDLGAIIILWHEYGHAIQRLLGVRFAHTIDYELQADCLAGATFAMAEKAKLIEPGDEDEAHNSLLYARDSSGTHHAAKTAHGSGSQRIASFDRGRQGGVNACALPWPQTLSRR